jgi:hypothetical protein
VHVLYYKTASDHVASGSSFLLNLLVDLADNCNN